MARVTVEDCVTRIPNRFELVMIASQRAREVAGGAPISVDRDNDKNPVVALREIAEETVDLDQLRDSMIGNFQRHVEHDEPEEDDLEALMRRELAGLSSSPDAEVAPSPEDVAVAASEALVEQAGLDEDVVEPDQDVADQDVADQEVAGQEEPGQEEPDQDTPDQDTPDQDEPDQNKDE